MLARIDKWQPTLNAFARVEAEAALKSAKAADRALAAGKAKGPLHGVPLAHKDMYYVEGQARRMRLEDPQGLGSRPRPRRRSSG